MWINIIFTFFTLCVFNEVFSVDAVIINASNINSVE